MMTEQGQRRGWQRDKQSVSDGEELVMKEGEGMIGMTQSKTLKLLEREGDPYLERAGKQAG